MFYLFIICIIIGLLDAKKKIQMASHGIGCVTPSRNLFRFLINE